MRVLAMITAASLVFPGMASDGVDDSDWRGGPSDAWFVNWDKALAESRKSGKALFLLKTGSDWCGWCKRLKANVLDKPGFIEFARENLVLVYLDSPNRNPLGKAQKAHNKIVTRALPFGGGVPHVLVMNSDGKKLGSIGGGGLGVDEYLKKLRDILSEGGEEVKGENAKRLFAEGYAVLGAEYAARLAALPQVTKEDFKAKITGVAVTDYAQSRARDMGGVRFLPLETELDVPFGKIALFRVEYDFPEGYGMTVRMDDCRPYKEKREFGPLVSNPFLRSGSKGTTYGFLQSFGKAEIPLRTAAIWAQSDPELDDCPYGWQISKVPVNLNFKEKPESDGEQGSAQQDANTLAVSKSVPKGWIEDFEAAKEKAAKEGKLILIEFSGSDWCGWCRKMDEEVFAKDKFVKDASRKFVLMMVDSPRDTSILSSVARRQNKELASKYGVRGYPTVVIVDPDGKEVARHSGFRKGGPQGYMRYLKDLTKGVKWPKKKAR